MKERLIQPYKTKKIIKKKNINTKVHSASTHFELNRPCHALPQKRSKPLKVPLLGLPLIGEKIAGVFGGRL